MARKEKPVYTINAFGEIAPAAVYSCLKTLCQEWDKESHYSTIWRHLQNNDQPYEDGRILIKKHTLIKSAYKRKA